MKINLGCGSTKLDGYLNVDVEESCKPDLIHDISKGPLPLEDGQVDEVVMFHAIEHISKRFHSAIFQEIRRVLKPNGLVIFSYPEFTKCVENWKRNEAGQKEFWEATIYGRQLYPADFHVCIMDSRDFRIVLENHGFESIVSIPEAKEIYNTITMAIKSARWFAPSYSELLLQDMKSTKVIA